MTPRPTAEARLGRSARRVAGWAVLGLLLLQFGWLLVMPPATGSDEFDHVYRASAVSMGDWKPAPHPIPALLGRGGLIPVREDIAEAAGPACARLRYTGAFNCRPYKELGNHVIEIASGTDTYNPLFYAVMGTLAKPFSGNAAIYAMRAVVIALSALAFGLSVFLVSAKARTRWPLAALLLAALPTTVYSTSVAAPNGLHMMAGLLVWTAAVVVLSAQGALRRTAYLALSGGLVTLVNTHTLGVVWMALIAVSVTALAGVLPALRALRPRNRTEGVAALVTVAAIAFELWWLWYARPNDPSRPEGGLPGSPWRDIAVNVAVWPLQAIGAFPLRNEPAPSTLYAIAIVVLGALTFATAQALRSQRRLRRTLALVLAFSALVPITMTYLTYHQFGITWQGRYGMPYSAGLFVLAGVALDAGRWRLPRSVAITAVPLWCAAQAVGQIGVLTKQRADHQLIAATGWWDPPIAILVGLGLLASMAWWQSLRVERTDGAVPPTG